MISEIQNILNAVLNTSYINLASNNDLFEVYIFSLIIRAAEAEGAQVSFRDINGGITSTLIFRTSPGQIYSRLNSYSYALIEFSSRPALETHLGIMVAGKSGVLHEADIAVLYSDEAENCRQNHVAPRSSKIVLSVECKYYSSNLGLGLARGYIGLVSDLSVEDPFFVTNASSSSVEKFLAHRAKHWEKEISPACQNDEVGRLFNVFRDVFKNYKAK